MEGRAAGTAGGNTTQGMVGAGELLFLDAVGMGHDERNETVEGCWL